MGSSKGVLLSGVALIIGIYTVGIKKADRVTAEVVEAHNSTSQAENIARSSLRFAIQDLANNSFAPGYYTKNFNLFGGAATYIIDGTSGTSANLTCTGTYNGTTVKVYGQVDKTGSYQLSAKKKKSGYKWTLSNVYVKLP